MSIFESNSPTVRTVDSFPDVIVRIPAVNKRRMLHYPIKRLLQPLYIVTISDILYSLLKIIIYIITLVIITNIFYNIIIWESDIGK